jgi:hypothetical protein
MLNDVLQILEKRSVFELLGKEQSYELILEIIKNADDYDCNQSEILSGIGSRLGICYFCLNKSDSIKNSLCEDCYYPDDDD